jgi:nucleotide-binding universal stress UspA family protein
MRTASINAVLRRQCKEELAKAVSALDADIDAARGRRLKAAGPRIRRAGSVGGGLAGYGPLRAVLLGSVSSALVRSAQSPLVVVPRGLDGESAP